ncbi:MAG: hypothetical protein DF280_01485 ['Brassica napus' phytoplasma]|nr:MAG: hypothetical protein DF280_01485 ['Brassica napus' phytoplasma]
MGKKKLSKKLKKIHIYHLSGDIKLKKELHNLDQIIKNLYQRLSDVNNLKYINEKIWDYSYERNQVAIKILSRSYQDPTMQELITNHQELVKIIKNLNQKYINLQYKLNCCE